MRDIYQVLYRKERQLQQLRREVEMLKIVIPLLKDDSSAPPMPLRTSGLTVIPFDRTRLGSQRLPSVLGE